jgi:hypothetical protein
MFDLKVINAVLTQLEEERGIPQAKIIDAIENENLSIALDDLHSEILEEDSKLKKVLIKKRKK